MHRTRTMCSENRSVRKIEVQIIEVGLYTPQALNSIVHVHNAKTLRNNKIKAHT